MALACLQCCQVSPQPLAIRVFGVSSQWRHCKKAKALFLKRWLQRRLGAGASGRAECSTSSSQSEYQMENGASLDFVVCRRFLVVHLFAAVDQPLLLWRNPLLLLHPLFNPLHLICGLDVNLYLLSRERLDFYQHLCSLVSVQFAEVARIDDLTLCGFEI